jgi:hypothetical protein
MWMNGYPPSHDGDFQEIISKGSLQFIKVVKTPRTSAAHGRTPNTASKGAAVLSASKFES